VKRGKSEFRRLDKNSAARDQERFTLESYCISISIVSGGFMMARCNKIDERPTHNYLSDQLYRALGSISGNIEEGYSRGTGKDRARFYEYSLGSARESRGWYYRRRYILGEVVVHHRLQLLSEIIRLLLTMVPQQRGYVTRDETAPYLTRMNTSQQEIPINENLEYLLKNVPLPTP